MVGWLADSVDEAAELMVLHKPVNDKDMLEAARDAVGRWSQLLLSP